jgi:hypothetical protein
MTCIAGLALCRSLIATCLNYPSQRSEKPPLKLARIGWSLDSAYAMRNTRVAIVVVQGYVQVSGRRGSDRPGRRSRSAPAPPPRGHGRSPPRRSSAPARPSATRQATCRCWPHTRQRSLAEHHAAWHIELSLLQILQARAQIESGQPGQCHREIGVSVDRQLQRLDPLLPHDLLDGYACLAFVEHERLGRRRCPSDRGRGSRCLSTACCAEDRAAPAIRAWWSPYSSCPRRQGPNVPRWWR